MFDADMHKEYLFLSYLIGLLPEEKEEPIDLDGKLKLEYYKLQKTFEGAIKLEKVDGQYVPSKKQGAQGIRQKSTLDEILDKINEKYKGQFTEGDRVMLGALHDKLIANDKLASSARDLRSKNFYRKYFPSSVWKCGNGKLYGSTGQLWFSIRGQKQVRCCNECTGGSDLQGNAFKKRPWTTGKLRETSKYKW